MRGWKHTGFNVDTTRSVPPGNRAEREALCQYILRNPFSAAKITLEQPGDVVIYRSRLNPKIHRNFEVFAAHNVSTWWRDYGSKHYPEANELLILADGGGSNGARVRAWKWELRRQVVVPFGLKVTVCHYPTGASKWNPAEHRLFGPISEHWAGQPLIDLPTIVGLIAGTTTKTGLKVNCRLIKRSFPTAQKVSNAQMRLLNLQVHSVLPVWNYTLFPDPNRN